MSSKIDRLGRVVIPKPLRVAYRLIENTPISFRETDEGILLTHAKRSCVFCGATEDLITNKTKALCRSCLKTLSSENEKST